MTLIAVKKDLLEKCHKIKKLKEKDKELAILEGKVLSSIIVNEL